MSIVLIAQIFATILAILVLARLFSDYKKKKESLQMTLFWTAVWLAILVFSYFPILIERLITLLGGKRTGLGTVFGMALVFVLYVNYRIYVKAHRVEKALNELSRRLALIDLERGKGKDKGKDKRGKSR